MTSGRRKRSYLVSKSNSRQNHTTKWLAENPVTIEMNKTNTKMNKNFFQVC